MEADDSWPRIHEETLAVFDAADAPGGPLTTREVADALDCTRRNAYGRLSDLAEEGALATKKVGARARVWWRPATDSKGDPGPAVENHDQFRSLVDAVEEYAIFTLDPDGTVATWNSGAARIKGYDREAVVGEHFSTFYTGTDREAGLPEQNLATAAAEGSVEDEGWRVRADGSVFWANVTITAVHDSGDLQGFTKVTRDMTERMRTEQALEREVELTGQILETSPTAIAVFDAGGSLERVNDRVPEVLGLSDAEMAAYVDGREPLLDGDEPVHEVVEPVFEVLRTGDPVTDREVRVDPDDGPSRWLSVDASPVEGDDGTDRVVVTADDVTRLREQARRLERQRDELEAELEDVFDRVSDGFYGLDEALQFTYVNDRAGDLLALDESAVVGRDVREVLDLTDEFDAALRTALERQEPVFVEDYYEPLDAWFENALYPSETGVSVYFRNVDDRKQRERELERYEAIVETVDDGVYLLDGDDEFTMVNGAFASMVGYDRDELVGSHAERVFGEKYVDVAEEKQAELAASDETVGALEEELYPADGDPFFVESRFGLFEFGGGETGRVGTVRDVTERKERERRLERQRARLAALDDLNGVVRDINEALVEQSTREEIEQTVVDSLSASDAYAFAGIVAVDPATDALRPRAEAGVDGYLAEVPLSYDPDDPAGQGPFGRAVQTGEMQVCRDVLADPDFEPWREYAEAYGYRSTAAIPVVHEGTTYGALGIYTDRVDGFSTAEREVVGQLGEVVGHAIASVERKRALMGDEVVEVEFRIRDLPRTLGLSQAETGTTRIDRTVAVGDDEYLAYGTVTAEGVSLLETVVDELSHWEAVSLLGDGDGTTSFEARLSGPPVVSLVASHGGYVEEAVIEDGDYRMTVHLPPTVDLRRVAEAIREVYPGVEMVSRRQVPRPGSTAADLETLLAEELTDRQRSALEAAFYAGFFEWPRDSTGEDVADSLGVSPPTFHQHVRKAERKVLATLFESDRPVAGRA